MPDNEWTASFDDDDKPIAELRVDLKTFEREEEEQEPKKPFVLPNFLPATVDRFADLKIEVFSNEHPPPHFRIKCGNETANYRISDCEQLNGGLKRYHRTIKAWHARNKPKLIEVWNGRRPTDCPVGKYREHGHKPEE
jgi:hypothetical protein